MNARHRDWSRPESNLYSLCGFYRVLGIAMGRPFTVVAIMDGQERVHAAGGAVTG